MVDYGGIPLSLTDAIRGHQLDSTIHYGSGWSPMREFNPRDVERLFVQDAIVAAGDGLPDIYAGWYCDVSLGVMQPRWAGSDADFAVYALAMRNALLLPLCDEFQAPLADLWETWGVPEAQRRIAAQERRLRAALEHGNGPGWETADLLAEVEAVCGHGKRQGRQVAFSCPWHADKHPSLMVEPVKRTWFCWPCNKGGGVIAWRRANGQ